MYFYWKQCFLYQTTQGVEKSLRNLGYGRKKWAVLRISFFKWALSIESWKQSQSWRELEGTARRGLMTSFTSDTGKYQSTREYQKYKKYKVEWNCHLPVFSWPRLEFGEGWGVWRAIIHPSSPEWDILEAEERKQINMHTRLTVSSYFKGPSSNQVTKPS